MHVETLEQQKDRLQRELSRPRVKRPAHGEIVLTSEELQSIRSFCEKGGVAGNPLWREYCEHIRAGGEWGDPLPSRPAEYHHLIDGLTSLELEVAGEDNMRCVVALFELRRFPGKPLGYRFEPPDEERHDGVYFEEFLLSGQLDRTLQERHVALDKNGRVWFDSVVRVGGLHH
jgi:hypothetical protein